jgi:uncharacterized SAM-binding protein YcdF (DUF218 family)
VTYTQPLILVFGLLAVIGLVRLRKCKGILLLLSAVVGFLLLSWPPFDWLVSRPLEARYPVRPFQPAPAEAIVVLSDTVYRANYERPYPLADHATYERCVYAAWLYHNWKPLPVLACGGAGNDTDQPFSDVMRNILEQAGVPENMIWTEKRSRSTHENALYGSEILRRHNIERIALVVDAQSMFRAEACFRKEGMVVVPAPCAFREFGPLGQELIPSWGAIARNEGVLHEVLGLAWYRLHGWI